MRTVLAILPIFMVIAAGYSLRAIHIVKPSWVSALNGFVFYVALPALIILSFANLSWSDPTVTQALLSNLTVTTLVGIALAIILKLTRLPKKLQATLFIVIMVSNTVYLGIPIANATLAASKGELTAAISSVQLVAMLIISLLAIEWVFLGARDNARIATNLMRSPLVIALGIGLFLSFVKLPSTTFDIVTPALKLLASTASPLALFALGAFLHGHGRPKRWPTLITASIAKLLLIPLGFALLLRLFGVSMAATSTSVVLAAMPTAVTAFVLTETYKLDRELSANVMVITTILSLITLPLIISLVS